MNLPRGICSRCGQSIAVRRNGTAREHRRLVPVVGSRRPVKGEGICPGSGKKVRP